MTNNKLLLVACLMLAPLVTLADANAAENRSQDNEVTWTKTCTSNGGKVIDMVAQFSTNSGTVNGLAKPFCQLTLDNKSYIVGLETLSTTTSSLASTFVQSLVIDPTKPLPTEPYANPSLNVCQNLHGSSISFYVSSGGFIDDQGQTDICVFGDGSSISAWSLIYLADGSTPELKALIAAPPLAISIPSIYAIGPNV